MKNDTFSIFILKANPTSLSQAEAFLKNRKWTVASSTNLREALGYIIKKQPQYVFITAEHPNKKVKILPKMLAQAFPLKVIGFAEKNSGESSRSLMGMGLEYILYPPVSGPAIERIILKMRKDEEAKAKDHDPTKPQFAGKSDTGDDTITFKAEASGEENQKQSFEQARAALAQMMNGDQEAELAKSDIYIQKGGNQNKYNETQAGPEHSKDFQAWEENERKKQPGYDSGSAEPDDGIYNPDQSSEAGPGNNNFSENSPEEKSSPELTDSEFQRPTAKMTPAEEAEYHRRKEKQIRYFSDAEQSADKDSIIVKGTAEAMAESVNITGQIPVKEIDATSNVACITIESPRFSGYLICALAEDQKVDKDLIEMINKRLQAFLRENGENVKDQDAMEIKIQAVDFIDWSIEQAQFLKKSTHNGREIAMAFFPHTEMKTHFEVAGPDKMIQLKLDELKADTPVEFDLYIYMPENNKYILYTPEGGNLYGRQKARLQAKGISHMHVKDTAIAGLKKYHAQNYLNDQIDVYKKAKTKAA